MKCPIGLDQVHCDNCYFWQEGKCDYERIVAVNENLERLLTIAAKLSTPQLRLVERFADFLVQTRNCQ